MWMVILGGLVIYKMLRCFFSDDVVPPPTPKSSSPSPPGVTPIPCSGDRCICRREHDSISLESDQVRKAVRREGLHRSPNFQPGFRLQAEYRSGSSHQMGGPGDFRQQLCRSGFCRQRWQLGVLRPRWQRPTKKLLFLKHILNKEELFCQKVFCVGKSSFLIQNFAPLNASIFSSLPSEIITYGQWEQLKPERKKFLPHWMKGTFCGVKKEMQETVHQQLGFILSTAPMWDRLELKGTDSSWESSQSLKGSKMMFWHCEGSEGQKAIAYLFRRQACLV